MCQGLPETKMSSSHVLSAPSIAHANATLARRFFAEQDRVRGGPVPELCAPNYMATIGGHPPMDRAGHERFSFGFYAGFPDARHEVVDVFATEDRVAVRFVIHGTHSGNFFGIPASNRPVRAVANVLMRMNDGRVTSLEGVFDEAGLLRQIGVLPSG